jgi:dihydroorotate dehydrogenase
MVAAPFYDPERSYSENYAAGPFGAFADGKVFVPDEAPQHTFLGQRLHLPFGIPAGPLVNGKFVKAALDRGFDLPTYKTVRTRAYAAHAWPNVLAVHPEGELHVGRRLTADHHYTEPLSITNSFGVPSFPPEVWQPDLAEAVAHARPGQCVVASFQGTLPDNHSAQDYIADFALGARMLAETGVKLVEVNLSCPNEGTSALLCFDAARSGAVCKALRSELGDTPLIIKIAYFANEAALRALLTAVGPFIDAVSAINTVSAEIVDAHGRQALPGEGRLSSGVCGACIRWAGLEMAQRLAAAREDLRLNFSIIGVGGVTHPEDYAAFRAAGADAVMSATGAMWNPMLAHEVKDFIAAVSEKVAVTA